MPDKKDRRFNMRIGNITCIEQGEGEFFEFEGLRYTGLKYEDVVMLEGMLISMLEGLNKVAQSNV